MAATSSGGRVEAYLDGVRRLATSRGRSTRTQFLAFVLTILLLAECIASLEVAAGARMAVDITLARVFQLACLGLTLAIVVRRLHDAGRSA